MVLDAGVTVPKTHQEFLIGTCQDGSKNMLAQYWQDLAYEYVSSAGQSDSFTRLFPNSYYFRSEYLDSLSQAFDKVPNELGAKLLHPCEIAFTNRFYLDPELAQSVKTLASGKKQMEIQALNLSVNNWSGLKRDLPALMASHCVELGFKQVRPNCFIKNVDGVIGRIEIDLGGSPLLLPQLPIDLHVYQPTNSDVMFKLVPDILCRGYAHYNLFQTPEEASLGCRALAYALNQFLATL
jgi:hypothetical protein